MSMNSHRGKEETNKKDFGKKSVTEQQEISKRSIPSENDVEANNEKLGQENARKSDEERSKHLH